MTENQDQTEKSDQKTMKIGSRTIEEIKITDVIEKGCKDYILKRKL